MYPKRARRTSPPYRIAPTGGLTGHTGGKNAAADGDHTANGIVVSDTVTAGINFFSPFFHRSWRAMTPSLR